MKAWKRIEPTKVTKVGFRQIVTKTFEMPDGRIETFDIKEREDWAAAVVIALTTDLQALVVRQFRPGTETIMDEIPGGIVEPHESDVEKVALRELAEETGYKPGSLTYLGKLNYDAYTSGWKHYFLAEDCVPNTKGRKLDPNEVGSQVLTVDIDTFIKAAKEGRTTDAGGVLLAYDKLREIQKRAKNS